MSFSIILDIFSLGALFYVLGKAAVLVVTQTDRIGRYYRIPEFLLGFVLLGFATSSPEFFVGLYSSAIGTAQVSIGNLFGGIIILLTLLIGIMTTMNHGVELSGLVSRPMFLGLTVMFLMPVFLLLDGVLSFWDGVSLIVLYGVTTMLLAFESYREKDVSLVRVVWSVLTSRHVKTPPLEEAVTTPAVAQESIGRAFALFGVSILAVMALTRVALDVGLSLATSFSIPTLVIGVLIFALGTNIPELTIAVASRRLKKQTLSLGNIVGSAATNIFLVGVVGMLGTVSFVAIRSLYATLSFVVVTAIFFFYSVATGDKITFREGLVHIALYGGFVVLQLALLTY